jgi:hypothetical protein
MKRIGEKIRSCCGLFESDCTCNSKYETEIHTKNIRISIKCQDCQQDKDYCCDCYNGGMYVSPDIPELDSEYHESTIGKNRLEPGDVVWYQKEKKIE